MASLQPQKTSNHNNLASTCPSLHEGHDDDFQNKSVPPAVHANKRQKPMPIVEQLQIPVCSDPAMNKQLALLGTIILSCKVCATSISSVLHALKEYQCVCRCEFE